MKPRAPLLDAMAAGLARQCRVDWDGLFDHSRDHWREMMQGALDALLQEAVTNMDGQIEAKEGIVKLVEFIRRER